MACEKTVVPLAASSKVLESREVLESSKVLKARLHQVIDVVIDVVIDEVNDMTNDVLLTAISREWKPVRED
ncbi:hypothetical protein ACX1C1_11385 [Paenibacillus sp. strain BS8-2]